MVRTGHALAYRKYSNKYIVQENIAKRNKSGLWAGSFEMPWNWRKKNQSFCNFFSNFLTKNETIKIKIKYSKIRKVYISSGR